MVYLMKSEWADYEVRLRQESYNNEKYKYFCIEVDPYNCDHGQFINLLEQIIPEYSTECSGDGKFQGDTLAGA